MFILQLKRLFYFSMSWVCSLRGIIQDTSSNAAYTPICLSIHGRHFYILYTTLNFLDQSIPKMIDFILKTKSLTTISSVSKTSFCLETTSDFVFNIEQNMRRNLWYYNFNQFHFTLLCLLYWLGYRRLTSKDIILFIEEKVKCWISSSTMVSSQEKWPPLFDDGRKKTKNCVPKWKVI